MQNSVKSYYREENDIWGLPQSYKNIKLYPILIKDIKYQELFYQIFSRPKSYIVNKDIMKSSYLKFILCVVPSNINMPIETMLSDFTEIMKYITHEDIDVLIRQIEGTGLSTIDIKLQIGSETLDDYEFDYIREIILEQNGLSIEFIEEYNPDLEESLRFNNRLSEGINLQDEIFTLMTVMKMNISDIEKLTIFQFKQLLERMMVLKEYDLLKPLLMTGELKLKSGELKNYFYHSEKHGRYDSIKLTNKDLAANEALKPDEGGNLPSTIQT